MTEMLERSTTWVTACPAERLQPGRGVAVLLDAETGLQAALFRTVDGTLHAVGNVDPVSGAAVMSRGIVGDRGGVPTVASPVYKEVYSLLDGRCLDDPSLLLPVFAVRERGASCEVGLG